MDSEIPCDGNNDSLYGLPISNRHTNIASLYNEPKKANRVHGYQLHNNASVIKEEGDWSHVQTPASGVKYLRKQDAKVVKNFAAIPKPTQQDIVDSAKMFLGLPYIWSGISGFGFDCSGLIHSVYKNHGIMIPRDSFVQAVNGTLLQGKICNLVIYYFLCTIKAKARFIMLACISEMVK